MMQKSDRPYFLDGAVRIEQASGYRAGMDAVLLSAAVQVKRGGQALELGCGAGTALICAAHRFSGAKFTGIEKHEDPARLARENVTRNAMQDRVNVEIMGVEDAIAHFGQDKFDAVFFNPPYQDEARSGNLPAPGRDTAFIADSARLVNWIHAANRLCKSGGYISIIHRAGRLTDILAALNPQCGDVRVLPICPRKGEESRRVLVRARKGSRSPSRLLAPLHLHGKTRQHAKKADRILKGTAIIDFE